MAFNPYENMASESNMMELEQQLELERKKNLHLSNAQMSMFNPPSEDNLIRWQLDLKEDLEKVYHLLRGDVVSEDEKGNVVYKEAKDDDLKPFNDFGIQLIMNCLSFYLNRNTLLSNYDEETINWKILDFGNEISDLILCRYKDMMITTSFEKEFKKEYGVDCEKLPNKNYAVKIDGQYMYLDSGVIEYIREKLALHLNNKVELYPMIVLELIDTVHSAYLRALDGGERTSLREARVVNQTEQIGQHNQMMMPQQQQKQRRLFHPSTWV
jgi:hypothetical protein